MQLSRHSVGIYQETSSHATRQGNTRPQSSQLAEPLWTDPDPESGFSVLELIFTTTNKQNKKAQAGIEWSNLLPNILASEEKATTNYTQVIGRGILRT